MVDTTTQTITVDRISNSGNAIAQQTQAGKPIHVPAGEVGETYEVRLEERGGHLVATVVDRAAEIQPRQPSIDSGPDTSSVAQDLLEPDRRQSHSFEVQSCPASGRLRSIPGEEKDRARRSRMTRRKL